MKFSDLEKIDDTDMSFRCRVAAKRAGYDLVRDLKADYARNPIALRNNLYAEPGTGKKTAEAVVNWIAEQMA